MTGKGYAVLYNILTWWSPLDFNTMPLTMRSLKLHFSHLPVFIAIVRVFNTPNVFNLNIKNTINSSINVTDTTDLKPYI